MNPINFRRSIFLSFLFLVCTLVPLSHCDAQKYACVNTDYVLKNIPDYVQAQKRIDKYVAEWQKELETKYQELETMKQSFQQEAYLLPENLQKKRKDDIAAKNQEIIALQQQRFSPGGDLDKKREELLKPVQDRVYSAIDRIAREKNYAFVFDRSASSTVLFANEKYDLSNQILEMLGFKPGDADAVKDADSDGKSSSLAKPKGGKSSRQGISKEPK